MHFCAVRLYISTHRMLGTSFEGDEDILSQNLKAEPLPFILLFKKKKNLLAVRKMD